MKSFCSQAYTSKGIVTLNPHTSEEIFTYIFKGYPNSLKRDFLERISNISESNGICAYDYNGQPISFLCEEKGFFITDGTFPNVAEPKTYGITDSVIDISAFQNPLILQKEKENAIHFFNEIKKEEKRCAGFISAAKGIYDDCRRYEEPFINKPHLNRFAAGLWKKYGTAPSGKIGKETKYFAEVLNGNGMDFPFNKFSSMCETVSVINDFSSSVSACVADKIRLYALSCGFDVLSFVDFLDAETVRHVIVPQLKYGFFSKGRYAGCQIENSKQIRKSRFYIHGNMDSVKSKKQFCRKAYYELTDEASKSIKRIEKLKNSLDNIYLSATDTEEFIGKNELKVTRIDKSLQKVYNIGAFYF